jgi:hypothetical protein
MVAPDVAGILFTANPLNGQRQEMLINAAYGLGESVVSGRVTPDTYRLRKGSPLAPLEQQAGSKAIRIDMQPGGGTLTAPCRMTSSSACAWMLPGWNACTIWRKRLKRIMARPRISNGRLPATACICCKRAPSPPCRPCRLRRAP